MFTMPQRCCGLGSVGGALRTWPAVSGATTLFYVICMASWLRQITMGFVGMSIGVVSFNLLGICVPAAQKHCILTQVSSVQT